jgi:hypothetical protein
MFVCQQYCVQVTDTVLQHLLPEIRSGINQQSRSGIFNENGTTQTLVPRIFRGANAAIAGYHWNALRSAGT